LIIHQGNKQKKEEEKNQKKNKEETSLVVVGEAHGAEQRGGPYSGTLVGLGEGEIEGS